MLKVITVTSQPERAKPLLDSLEKHGWSADCLVVNWLGFGTKLISVYNYLKEHPEVDRFIFCDAHDVVAVSGPDEFDEKIKKFNTRMVFSAEKGCWPMPQIDKFYPPLSNTPFRYLNSGLYYAQSGWFMDVFDTYPVHFENDDQLWATMVYLTQNQQYKTLELDFEQSIFNSHSFIADAEYTHENGRVQILGNEPIFLHGNGGGLPQSIYEMLKG